MFLTLPSAAALVIMPHLITTVLYERGAFDALATSGTAAALSAFACGLPAFVLIKVFSPAFFAREDTRTPMYYAGINALLNVILSIALFPSLAHVGIAIATSISAWVNVVLLFVHLQLKGHWPLDGATLRRLLMMVAASIGMGAALYWFCLLYTSPSPRDRQKSRMPSSA